MPEKGEGKKKHPAQVLEILDFLPGYNIYKCAFKNI